MTWNREWREPSDPSELPASAGDFFVVSAGSSVFPVSTAMAHHIDACLGAVPMPEWVVFVDLTGARVRLRTRCVEYVAQCSAEQRARLRAFHRAWDGEREDDGEA